MNSTNKDYASLISQAWEGKLEFRDLIDRADSLAASKQYPLAAVLYRTWLARNDTPLNHFAHFNLGVTLFSAGDFSGARDAYLEAIRLAPTFVQPHFNLGLVYEKLKLDDAAIAEWRWVVKNKAVGPGEPQAISLLAHNNLGRLYENNRQYPQALHHLSQSLALEPNQPDVIHHWVFLRERQCEWPIYTPVEGCDPDLMRRSTSALAMLSLTDDPEIQLDAARAFVESKVRQDLPALAPTQPYAHKKIRIAYLSSDFCLHPVAMLTAELFELHDRRNFEIYGFCWSNDDGSALRKRIINGMGHFERIGHLNDEAAARLIREHEIDILIDLHGQTLGARPNLLAWRPAPVQITYLGLPATTAMPAIDYVIADRFLIPEASAKFYSEKPLYMPDVYQVSDRKRLCAPVLDRKSYGLPAEGFVFCSFNNNYKYTPEMFETWTNIVRRVPGSVLWLLADNPWSEANLRKAWAKYGMDETGLIFASRELPEKYLARYGVADVFLDTFPFNAGTTANDALWMALPVLTCAGRSFASRMAGALLTAAGLEELITCNLHDYEEKAVALANSPDDLKRIRRHLDQVKRDGVLFDTPRFVSNLEKHFERIVGQVG